MPTSNTPEGAREPDAAMGAQTREAVADFLARLHHITGATGQQDLALIGLTALCSFAKASDHDLPEVVRRLLVTLSARARRGAGG